MGEKTVCMRRADDGRQTTPNTRRNERVGVTNHPLPDGWDFLACTPDARTANQMCCCPSSQTWACPTAAARRRGQRMERTGSRLRPPEDRSSPGCFPALADLQVEPLLSPSVPVATSYLCLLPLIFYGFWRGTSFRLGRPLSEDGIRQCEGCGEGYQVPGGSAVTCGSPPWGRRRYRPVGSSRAMERTPASIPTSLLLNSGTSLNAK
jgi:hypothetical protein